MQLSLDAIVSSKSFPNGWAAADRRIALVAFGLEVLQLHQHQVRPRPLPAPFNKCQVGSKH